MTDAPKPLFDPALRAARIARAVRQGFAGFLHAAAADEVEERLDAVNRPLADPVLIGPMPGLWQRGALAGARAIPDDATLDLAPGSSDLIVHALALHHANDPVGQLIQARRALRPDGLFLGVLFAGQTLAALRTAWAEAEIAARGGLSPRVSPMADLRDLGGLLQRAGFALPVADLVPVDVTYASATALMRDLRAMGEGNVQTARDPRPVSRTLLAQVEAAYHRIAPAEDGRIAARFELAVLTGWAPHADQPKPLRPGSATERLADALGTVEHKTSETGK